MAGKDEDVSVLFLVLVFLAVLASAGGAVVGGEILVSGLTGKLSISDLLQLAANAGFSGNDLITAVSIALAESRGNPMAKGDINVPGPGDASYGLWQINSHWHPEFGPDFTRLFDPPTNAAAAFSIYSAAGGSFQPWSTFKTGAYQSYVSQVQTTLQV